MTRDCCFIRYFTSEWSFAQLRGLEGHSLCAFGIDPHTLIIISADGSFMTAKFNEPGEMVSESEICHEPLHSCGGSEWPLNPFSLSHLLYNLRKELVTQNSFESQARQGQRLE